MLSIIVAIAKNNAIGLNNQLLWHLPEDLKFFKQKTLNHTIIMGLKTYLSLPVRPLPNRRTIVVCDDKTVSVDGCIMAYSIEDVMNLCEPNVENFICGGGSIYRQFMPICKKMYITHVEQEFEADVFFPDIDKNTWTIVSQSDLKTDDKNLQYRFVEYQRM